jgi:hypothetical protein
MFWDRGSKFLGTKSFESCITCTLTVKFVIFKPEQLNLIYPVRSNRLTYVVNFIQTLVVPLIAGIAEYMVSANLGTKAEEVTSWEPYIKSKMYNPKVFGRQMTVKVAPTPVPEVHHEDMPELLHIRQLPSDIQRYLFLRYLQVCNGLKMALL